MKIKTTLYLCTLTFGLGIALGAHKPQPKPVVIVKHVPVYQHIKQSKYFNMQRDKIAAVIPQSALK